MALTNTQVGNELCGNCATLNINRHKFIRQLEDSSISSNDGFDEKGLEAMNIGFLDEFYQRKNRCPLCRLIYEATHHDSGKGIGQDGLDQNGRRVPCWLDWQLDGRLLMPQSFGHDASSGARTRRLRLFSKTNDFKACYLVPLRQNRDIQSPSFQARIVHPEQASISRLRGWLDLCESQHQCHIQHLKPETPLRIRVVDVIKRCIVEIDSTQRYCTLSYCWGAIPQYRLLMDNYESLRCPGSLRDPTVLPRTISHTLDLTAALGEKYVWIDALCICQDDPEDWETTAPLMDTIYGNSIMTICAASGVNSAHGLPGSKERSRSLFQSVQNCNGLSLLAVKALEDHIEPSPWNTRAWIFQERMLSKRCLIFVNDRVFFQCRQATWSEELECESSVSFWTLDTMHSPLNLFTENPIRLYARSVELYSGRKLAVIRDRLIAFEGFARSLAQNFPGTFQTSFHYGLPAWYFDWALLWELKTAATRITENDSRIIFPSWSWCGWHGASEWRMSTTSTVLLNLHEWLMQRTWIIWYLGTDSEQQLVFRADQVDGVPARGRWAGYGSSGTNTNDNPTKHLDAYGRELDRQTSLPTKPTYPPRTGHLHFFTWSAFFKLSRRSMADSSFKSALGSGVHRFGIVDCKGDWCGTILLNDSYFNQVGGSFEFIAISEARDFTLEECDSWTHYIPMEREGAEWYLYYALMIRWSDEKKTAERLGLAKIYKTAFQSGSFGQGTKWKEIVLG